MNQYEIELRDKFAVLALNQYFKEYEVDQNVPRLSSKELAEWVYDRADDMMIERDEPKEYIMKKIELIMEEADRQKHLDTIERTNYHEDVGSVEVQCLCGWIGQQHMLVDDKCPDCQTVFSPYPPRKIQGTECDR